MQVVTIEQEHDSGERLHAEIVPGFGSNLMRLRYGELDLLRYDFDLLRDGRWTGTPVLWPIPNRVTDKRYRFGTKRVSLEDVVRPEGNWPLIHGLVDDQSWDYDPPAPAQLRVWTELVPGAKHFEHFPFPSRLTLDFSLHSEGLRLEYTVDNLGDDALPFAFALHPYFALLDGEDSKIQVPADSVMETDAELLPSGRLLPVDEAGCDLRHPVPAVDTALDHVFTDLHAHAPPRLIHPRSGVEIQLNASEDFSHVVVHTLKAASDGFVCIENQTGSTDAINLHTRAIEIGDTELQRAAHLLVVDPGQSHSGHVDYRIHPLGGPTPNGRP